jgi:integrase
MSRRTYGTGSLRQRADGRWEGTARLGRVGGQYARKSVYGRTRAEALTKLRAAQRDVARGVLSPPSRLTVAQLLTTWLEAIEPTLGEHTRASYRTVVRLHCIPAIGYVRLHELTPLIIQHFYADLLRYGARGRQPLAPASVRRTHLILHAAFAWAERTDLLTPNPVSKVRPPRAEQRVRETLTLEEAHRVLAALRGHWLEPFVWLALTTGLRGGELLRLKWADVDLVHGSLTVRKSKSPAGQRVVVLPPEVVALLSELAARRAGDTMQRAESHIIVSSRGVSYANLGNIRAVWYRLLAAHGLPRVTLHGLRHTWATLHRHLGTSLQTVSEMAGHHSIAVTADVYTRANPQQQRAAAEALGRLLGGSLNSVERSPTDS